MTHGAWRLGPARLPFAAGLLLPLVWWSLLSPPFDGDETLTPTASETPAPSPSDTPAPPPSDTALPSATDTPASTPTPGVATESPTPIPSTDTPTPIPSDTPIPTAPRTPYPPRTILISEVAWAGTLAYAVDEWIELHNTTDADIDLTGWILTDEDDLRLALRGVLPAHGFFLLERTDDTTVADIPADQVYTGSLRDSGESLWLLDPTGAVIDSANAAGGAWPAGGGSAKASMQRLGGDDFPGNWHTFTGPDGIGHDASGNPIAGTPRSPNTFAAPTLTPTLPPTPVPPLAVMINEIAWAGTRASASDEWIELYNTTAYDIDLTGWILTDEDDLRLALRGLLPAYGFFLLERTDDTAISDITADQTYTGSLRDGGETLWLRDPSGAIVDTANLQGGSWPAGSSSSKASMERRGGEDLRGNWGSYTGYYGQSHDAAGNPIAGTPRASNSLLIPTPVPTWIPGRVVINEVLIRPHYDWEGTGGVNTGDEFIELYNLGPAPVHLRGWLLDDIGGGGSQPYALPGVTLDPHAFAVFYHSRTHIALNDAGDSVRLLAPDGRLIDEITYRRVRAYNLSYGRLPDGSDHLAYGLWPTPGQANLLFVEPIRTAERIGSALCPGGGTPEPRFARLARHPAMARWMAALGLVVCR
ncbi:MAG: lamin tail domain-containing protein [Chloroflexota bacterium]